MIKGFYHVHMTTKEQLNGIKSLAKNMSRDETKAIMDGLREQWMTLNNVLDSVQEEPAAVNADRESRKRKKDEAARKYKGKLWEANMVEEAEGEVDSSKKQVSQREF